MGKQFKKIGVILGIALILCSSLQAQKKLNPFRPIPLPNLLQLATNDSAAVKITAYRFTGPMAGYDFLNKKIVTGLGFGWNKLHFDKTARKWITDLSINGVIFAGGSSTPSIGSNNIISIGAGAGFDNNLIHVIPCYNLPLESGTKGQFGIVLTLSNALN